MHNTLYNGAGAREWGRGGPEDLRTFLGYARTLNLDSAAIQKCVENNNQARQIQTDFQQAAAQNVRSTPAFFINGRLLLGAQPFDVWKRVFEQILGN